MSAGERAVFLSDLRSKAKRQGTNLEELLTENDRAKTGRMHIATFRKMVANAGLYVEEEKFLDLTEPYIRNDQFFYRTFIEDTDAGAGQATTAALTDDQLREFGAPLRDRGIDLVDFLRQFDRQRSGHVPAQTFLRNVSSTPLGQIVCKAYTNPVTGQVEYVRLAADVKRVLDTRFSANEIDPHRVQQLVDKLAQLFRQNGVDPFAEFQKIDRTKRRRIQPAQFVQVVKNLGAPFTDSDMQQLSDAFTENAVFDYVTLCDELERSMKIQMSRPAPQQPVRVNVDEVLARLSREMQERHSQLRSQMQQFDPGNTGMVPFQRFSRAMVMNGFSVTDVELLALEKEFGDGRGGFDYLAFIGVVLPQQKPAVKVEDVLLRLQDHLLAKKVQLRPLLQKFDVQKTGLVQFGKLVATLRNVEFDMTPEEQGVLQASFSHGREELTGIDEICELVDPTIEAPKPEPAPMPRQEYVDPATLVLDIMTRIAVQIQKYQLMLMDEFKVYDTKHNGMIAIQPFTEVLMSIPHPPTDSELQTLVDFYMNRSSREINYDSFCQELEEFAGTRLRRNPEIAAKILSEEPQNASSPLEPVLKKIKMALYVSKTPADALFSPYDSGTSGCIPETRLKPILQDFGLQVTQQEIGMLLDQFQDQRIPEKFNYRRLCQVLNSIPITQSDLSSASTGVQTRQVSAAALRFCSEFREKLLARHKRIGTPFAGITSPGMSPRDFRHCLDSFGLVIRESDMQMLLREYKMNMQGDIDWQHFCRDVESNRTV